MFFMLQLFYLDVAYVSHTCCKRMSQMFHLFQMYVAFEYFMLQVQTTALVSMRHRVCDAIVKEAGASLPGGLEETGVAPVWKRRGRVIRATSATDLKREDRMRARRTELARVTRESERTRRSSRGHLDIRALVQPQLK
jgi:hypothetical protein